MKTDWTSELISYFVRECGTHNFKLIKDSILRSTFDYPLKTIFFSKHICRTVWITIWPCLHSYKKVSCLLHTIHTTRQKCVRYFSLYAPSEYCLEAKKWENQQNSIATQRNHGQGECVKYSPASATNVSWSEAYISLAVEVLNFTASNITIASVLLLMSSAF